MSLPLAAAWCSGTRARDAYKSTPKGTKDVPTIFGGSLVVVRYLFTAAAGALWNERALLPESIEGSRSREIDRGERP